MCTEQRQYYDSGSGTVTDLCISTPETDTEGNLPTVYDDVGVLVSTTSRESCITPARYAVTNTNRMHATITKL